MDGGIMSGRGVFDLPIVCSERYFLIGSPLMYGECSRRGMLFKVTSSLLLLVERRLLPAAHVGRSLKFFEGPSAGFF